MRSLLVICGAALAAGCSPYAPSLIDWGPDGASASAWPASAPDLAAAGEDDWRGEVDEEAISPGPAKAELAGPKVHRFGFHMGAQTVLAIPGLDADEISPRALLGLYYRFNPGSGVLAYEAGFDYAGTGLDDYPSGVEAESRYGIWRASVLYAPKGAGFSTSTYVSGGFSIVSETVDYENSSDGRDLATYRSADVGLAIGAGQVILDGQLEFRYEMTFALGSPSDAWLNYLTVGYNF